ncbi:MAG: single-stranded-DNA-specific exonuclease RecJ [Bacteroidota bacterium]
MIKKKWTIKKQENTDLIKQLASQQNIPPVLAGLLVQRGIDTYEKAQEFFHPSLKLLHDPFLMKDMDKAVMRLDRALTKKEKILIYGDYDVDGTTAVALLYSFLKKRHPFIEFYIPDRYSEGYGISAKGIDFAAHNDFTLIISLDCGIKNIAEIEEAAKHGIDFIVCDHHITDDESPKCCAVLDPKRKDCAYPYKELTGCGVGFKLAEAFCQRKKIPITELYEYLDMVAISIASDIVPITGENRIIMHYGLQQLNAKPRAGFRALLDISQIKKEMDVTDVVFIIGPRINAAGRIDTGRNAVRLLISDDYEEAKQIAYVINDDNTTRKNLDAYITQEALELIEKDDVLRNAKSTVLFGPDWHKGVLGIVASRLIEHYYRPTIVLTEYDGLVTGSARSVKEFDLYSAISDCSDLLEHFGGHKCAAGLTLKKENLEAFSARFEKIVSENMGEIIPVPEIEIDAEIDLSSITQQFYNVIKSFGPFGPENMKPLFMTSKLQDTGYAKIVGNNHLKFTVSHPGQRNGFGAIAFNQGAFLDVVAKKKNFEACYCIEENTWNERKSLQLNVKDIRCLDCNEAF